MRTAADGTSGLELARTLKPRAILLDVMMPKLSGFEVCRRLRADPDTRAAGVLMVTALDQPTDVEKAIDAGTDDFVTRPVNKTELLLRVRALLGAVGEAMASAAPVLVIATDIPSTLRRPGVVRGVLHETSDQQAMFAPVTKGGFTVRAADQIGMAQLFLARARLTGGEARAVGLILAEAMETAREMGATALADRAVLAMPEAVAT